MGRKSVPKVDLKECEVSIDDNGIIICDDVRLSDLIVSNGLDLDQPLDVTIKAHKESKPREKKPKFSYSCGCSGFVGKSGELDLKCNKCGQEFEIEEIC